MSWLGVVRLAVCVPSARSISLHEPARTSLWFIDRLNCNQGVIGKGPLCFHVCGISEFVPQSHIGSGVDLTVRIEHVPPSGGAGTGHGRSYAQHKRIRDLLRSAAESQQVYWVNLARNLSVTDPFTLHSEFELIVDAFRNGQTVLNP